LKAEVEVARLASPARFNFLLFAVFTGKTLLTALLEKLCNSVGLKGQSMVVQAVNNGKFIPEDLCAEAAHQASAFVADEKRGK
jgi:hypothetical protein